MPRSQFRWHPEAAVLSADLAVAKRTDELEDAEDDYGLITYDPGFTNTASCRSAVTFIDGDVGQLLYRGYPIEQLAENCNFLEVTYLLKNGELPNASQKVEFETGVMRHTMLHEQIREFFNGFRRDAHPMAVMCGVVGALSAFYHDSAACLLRDGVIVAAAHHGAEDIVTEGGPDAGKTVGHDGHPDPSPADEDSLF